MSTSTSNELHVIFGAGPLGKWTARELVRMGKCVRLINRSGTAKGLPAEAEVVEGNAYDVTSNIALTKGAAAVYQCAQPPYNQWPDNFPRMQAAILEAAAANGAKFIAAENLYLYGDPGGQPLREDLPYNAHTKKGKVRKEMTEAVFAAHRTGKVRAAAVRGSNFFGPDDLVYARLVFHPALTGKSVKVLGSLNYPHTFTYAPDFGRALAIVGTRDEALGQAWHVPSEPPLTQAQFVKLLSEELSHPVKPQVGTPILVRATRGKRKSETAARYPVSLFLFKVRLPLVASGRSVVTPQQIKIVAQHCLDFSQHLRARRPIR